MARGTMGRLLAVAVVAAACVLVPMAAAATSARTLPASTRFSVPAPDQGAIQQGLSLLLHRDLKDAVLIAKMETIPRATWLTGGSGADAAKQVRTALAGAKLEGAVPVLVVYNIPGRDCGGYSAGGAQTTSDYDAYIDAVSTAVGAAKAIMILEPDALANLPSDCGYSGVDTAALDAARYAQIGHAISAFESAANPNVSLYLDAGHSAWHNAADMSTRLVTAGVDRTQGFFLNVSNYQYTQNGVFYGTWLSDCIALIHAGQGTGNCGDEYYNGGPATNWAGGAMNPYGVWSETASDPALNTSGVDSRYALFLGSIQPTTHFVLDTSRNGNGPWNYAAAGYPNAGVAQDWCNPPGRGLGALPTASTGNPLVDAYLWIKTPGESDGSCTRGTAGPGDPAWGVTDPAAGAWFPQQALQLAQLANPALLP
jgi:endoglucanase